MLFSIKPHKTINGTNPIEILMKSNPKKNPPKPSQVVSGLRLQLAILSISPKINAYYACKPTQGHTRNVNLTRFHMANYYRLAGLLRIVSKRFRNLNFANFSYDFTWLLLRCPRWRFDSTGKYLPELRCVRYRDNDGVVFVNRSEARIYIFFRYHFVCSTQTACFIMFESGSRYTYTEQFCCGECD